MPVELSNDFLKSLTIVSFVFLSIILAKLQTTVITIYTGFIIPIVFDRKN